MSLIKLSSGPWKNKSIREAFFKSRKAYHSALDHTPEPHFTDIKEIAQKAKIGDNGVQGSLFDTENLIGLVKKAAIEIKKSHEGSLHSYLNIPEGESIPTNLLEEKMKSETDPSIRKKINFAINARKWRRK